MNGAATVLLVVGGGGVHSPVVGACVRGFGANLAKH